LIFDFDIDFDDDPEDYVDAAITNLFYWNNIMHDIFYQYGFNEVSGNFQENNFGKGGLGNDAVIANAQDGSGFDNANFATPPDGQRPKMRMYVWDYTPIFRDGDLESDIIIHEYSHGISNRLTGGPANVNCLNNGESGGMGEGWGDFFAILLSLRPENTSTQEFVMGSYVTNNLKGIRTYPYTTDILKNPLTYGYLNQNAWKEVHKTGEIWTSILWETYWNFVGVYPFNSDWYNAAAGGGNQKILKNVVDGLKLQPCNPTFINARDAIIQADVNNFGGANRCLLWKGFAKRGLGKNAFSLLGFLYFEDFTLPTGC